MGAVAGIASAVGAVASIFKKPKASSAPPAPPPMPTPEPPKIDTGAAVDAAAEQAQQQTTQRRRAIARNRTVFTNPLGIAGEAQTVRKALLGQ